jgi:hypothetical protein
LSAIKFTIAITLLASSNEVEAGANLLRRPRREDIIATEEPELATEERGEKTFSTKRRFSRQFEITGDSVMWIIS